MWEITASSNELGQSKGVDGCFLLVNWTIHSQFLHLVVVVAVVIVH
ncbi:hypothetical protein RintRC_6251 [Richelia intracellularis]|nr:hypothetical protein RintRC_6251 [Richelia intracellularis]